MRCKVQSLSIDVVAALIERVLNDSSPAARPVEQAAQDTTHRSGKTTWTYSGC